MNEKRRDNKGRLLFKGEMQEKNGRYKFRYNDLNGDRQTVYSWKLNKTDALPKGKRDDISLREKEEEVRKLLSLGVNDTKITIVEMFKKYISQKKGIRDTTMCNYRTVYRLLKRNSFGKRKIKDVTPSQAKQFLIELQNNGFAFTTIKGVKMKVRAVFQMALEDGLILKNPFDFNISSVIENTSVARKGLSDKEEGVILNFIKNDSYYNKYYDAFFILFNTGLRISEFCGLTIKDINFKDNSINVSKQLLSVLDQNTQKMRYAVTTPKTKTGIRKLPMSNDVRQAFQRIINNRRKTNISFMVDGYNDFLIFTRNDRPFVAQNWQREARRISQKYLKQTGKTFPPFTPHICRHTYCSKMARNGMPPKTLQYLMGHTDISVTLNVYTHIGFEDARNELDKIVANL